MSQDKEEFAHIFLGQPKDKRQGDILFSKRDEAVFSMLHAVFGEGKFTKQNFVKHGFRVLITVCQLLQFAAVILDYSNLASSKVITNYSSLNGVLTLDIYKAIGRNWSDSFIFLHGTVQFVVYLMALMGYIVVKMERNSSRGTFIKIVRVLMSVFSIAFYATTFQLLLSPVRCSEQVEIYYNNESLCNNSLQRNLFAVSGAICATLLWGSSFLVNLGTSIPTKTRSRMNSVSMSKVTIALSTAMTGTIVFMTVFSGESILLVVTALYLLIIMFQFGLMSPYFHQKMNALFCGSLASLSWGAALGYYYMGLSEDELNNNYLVLAVCATPVIFTLGTRVSRWRMEEIEETMNAQLLRPSILGDKYNWSVDASELINPKSLERFLKQQQTYNLQRGVGNTVFANMYFSSDAELFTRPLFTGRLPEKSIQREKYSFICRLIFAKSISDNPDEAMTFVHFACFIWYTTYNLSTTMELLRSAMGRNPGMNIRFMVYAMVIEIEKYKQQYTSGEGDIVTMLEFRKLHDKAHNQHESCIRRLRSVWKTLASPSSALDENAVTTKILNALDLIKETEATYETIKEKFPFALDVMKEYALFRRNAMSDFHGARELLQKHSEGDNNNPTTMSYSASSSFSDSQEDEGGSAQKRSSILVREFQSYKAMRSLVWLVWLIVLLAGGLMIYITNTSRNEVMTHASNLQTSSYMMLGGITATYYSFLAEYYTSAEFPDFLTDEQKAQQEAYIRVNFDASNEKALEYIASFVENKDALYVLAEEYNMNLLLDMFQNVGEPVLVRGQNVTMDFSDLSILYADSIEKLAKMSFDERAALNETVSYELAVLHKLSVKSFIPCLKATASLQLEEVKLIHEQVLDYIVYAGIAAGMAGIFGSIVIIINLVNRFSLFTAQTAAVTSLAKQIDSNTARKLYNEMTFHHKNVVDTNAQEGEMSHMKQLEDDDDDGSNGYAEEILSMDATTTINTNTGITNNNFNNRAVEDITTQNNSIRNFNNVATGATTDNNDNTTKNKTTWNVGGQNSLANYMSQFANNQSSSESDEFEDLPISDSPVLRDGKNNSSFKKSRKNKLSREFSDVGRSPIQDIIQRSESNNKSGSSVKYSKRARFSRGQSVYVGGEEEEVIVKYKKPIFARILLAFQSGYTRRVGFYLAFLVSLVAIAASLLCRSWFDVYRQSVFGLYNIVEIRAFFRESVMHSGLFTNQNELVESLEEALTESLDLTIAGQAQYRDMLFGTTIDGYIYDGWAFKDTELTNIIFTGECYYANMEVPMYNGYNVTCSNLDLYTSRDQMYQGLDAGIQTFTNTQYASIYAFLTDNMEEPLLRTSLQTTSASDMTDLEMSFVAFFMRLSAYLEESDNDVESNILILCFVMAAYSGMILILNSVFILHKLHSDISKTAYFIKLLPWHVVTETPLIFQHIQDDEMGDLDTIAI